MMVYKKRLIDHPTWLPGWTRTNGPDFGLSPRPVWLRTIHCKVRFTRRALCAVLLTHNPAQARWFGYKCTIQRPGRSTAYARYFAKNSPPDCFLYAVTPAYLSDLGVR